MIPYLCEIKIQQHTLIKTRNMKCFEPNRAESENSLCSSYPFTIQGQVRQNNCLEYQQISLGDLFAQFNDIF